MNFTIATAQAIGVTNKNQEPKISARLRCGQNEIWRSIGNEARNPAKPPKEGRHHTRTGHDFVLLEDTDPISA